MVLANHLFFPEKSPNPCIRLSGNRTVFARVSDFNLGANRIKGIDIGA